MKHFTKKNLLEDEIIALMEHYYFPPLRQPALSTLKAIHLKYAI